MGSGGGQLGILANSGIARVEVELSSSLILSEGIFAQHVPNTCLNYEL